MGTCLFMNQIMKERITWAGPDSEKYQSVYLATLHHVLNLKNPVIYDSLQ